MNAIAIPHLHLAPELLHMIFEFLSLPNLFSSMLVSKAWSEAATTSLKLRGSVPLSSLLNLVSLEGTLTSWAAAHDKLSMVNAASCWEVLHIGEQLRSLDIDFGTESLWALLLSRLTTTLSGRKICPNVHTLRINPLGGAVCRTVLQNVLGPSIRTLHLQTTMSSIFENIAPSLPQIDTLHIDILHPASVFEQTLSFSSFPSLRELHFRGRLSASAWADLSLCSSLSKVIIMEPDLQTLIHPTTGQTTGATRSNFPSLTSLEIHAFQHRETTRLYSFLGMACFPSLACCKLSFNGGATDDVCRDLFSLLMNASPNLTSLSITLLPSLDLRTISHLSQLQILELTSFGTLLPLCDRQIKIIASRLPNLKAFRVVLHGNTRTHDMPSPYCLLAFAEHCPMLEDIAIPMNACDFSSWPHLIQLQHLRKIIISPLYADSPSVADMLSRSLCVLSPSSVECVTHVVVRSSPSSYSM